MYKSDSITIFTNDDDAYEDDSSSDRKTGTIVVLTLIAVACTFSGALACVCILETYRRIHLLRSLSAEQFMEEFGFERPADAQEEIKEAPLALLV